VALTVVAPPSSVDKCLWEVFVWGFGVLFLLCVCVGVGGVVLCRCVCVCDLFIFVQVTGDNVCSMAFCDVDEDGDLELLVGSDDFEVRALRNRCIYK